ncbi:MAG: MFS transporter [Gemmatimonadaceae bacterium]|jgi:MFS family permease|nr:MFS transporter [Gemmatimonadaceae bacterium]
MRRLLPDLTVLGRAPAYRRILIGQAVSAVGSFVTMVALPYQVYTLTRSSFAVGMLGVAELVPLLGAALLGGAYADAHDRRRLVLASEIVLASASVLLAVNASLASPRLWALYVLAALASAASGFHRPALEAMVPRLVARDDIPAVAALRGAVGTAAAVGGPALGGVLLTTVGVSGTYVFDVLTFVVSLVAVWGVPAVPPADDAEPPSIARIGEGVRYARSRQELMGSYLIDFNAMLFGMPNALFPAMAERLGGGAVLGVMYAAPALGAFLVSSTSRWTTRVSRYGAAIVLAASAWGVAIVGFGLASAAWVALLMLVCAGAADMVSALFRMSLWNQTIPDSYRGRLAGIEQISYMSGPMLGNAEAGLVASLTSVRTSVVSGGVLCVLGSVALAVLLPKFWRFDMREHAAPTAG